MVWTTTDSPTENGEEVPSMISNLTMPTWPMPAAACVRMRGGAPAGVAMICADAEVYTKGTTVFADRAASAADRPNDLGTTGARCWSPPV